MKPQAMRFNTILFQCSQNILRIRMLENQKSQLECEIN